MNTKGPPTILRSPKKIPKWIEKEIFNSHIPLLRLRTSRVITSHRLKEDPIAFPRNRGPAGGRKNSRPIWASLDPSTVGGAHSLRCLTCWNLPSTLNSPVLPPPKHLFTPILMSQRRQFFPFCPGIENRLLMHLCWCVDNRFHSPLNLW